VKGGRGAEKAAGGGKDRIDCLRPRSGEGTGEGSRRGDGGAAMVVEKEVLVLGGLGLGVSMADHGRC
jgi:hypothetical protein